MSKNATGLTEVTIGRIVHFHVGDDSDERLKSNGASVLPAIIVRVNSENNANLKVFTDGPEDVWVTSASRGREANQWWFHRDKG